MIKKYYNLQKGDIAVMEGKEYIFLGVDGMYAKWTDERNGFHIGHYDEYELKEDGKWYPVSLL